MEITADGVEGGAVGKRLSLVVVGLTMGLETGNPDNVVSVGLKVVPVGEALRLLIQIIIIPATTRARTISDRIIKRRLFLKPLIIFLKLTASKIIKMRSVTYSVGAR